MCVESIASSSGTPPLDATRSNKVAAVARRAVLNQEDLTPSRGDLQAKSLEVFIPPDRIPLSRSGEGVDGALGELAGRNAETMSWLLERRIGSLKNPSAAISGMSGPHKSEPQKALMCLRPSEGNIGQRQTLVS
jgi:hypothetical protein